MKKQKTSNKAKAPAAPKQAAKPKKSKGKAKVVPTSDEEGENSRPTRNVPQNMDSDSESSIGFNEDEINESGKKSSFDSIDSLDADSD